ncbi:hypothetical protein BAE44_0001034, partial [Dichanthelium oligosanthes]
LIVAQCKYLVLESFVTGAHPFASILTKGLGSALC